MSAAPARRVLVALMAACLVLLSSPAQADDGIESRDGWCRQGQGLTFVVDFSDKLDERDKWPNDRGYEVRCLSGPALGGLNLSRGGEALHDVAAYTDIPRQGSGEHQSYWDMADFRAVHGTFDQGWGTSWQSGDNVDRFVGVAPEGSDPAVVPQFERGGDAPGGPSDGGTPGAPGANESDGADPDADPDDRDDEPDPRAPRGEAGAEGAEDAEEPEADRDGTSEPQAVEEAEVTSSLTGGSPLFWILVGFVLLTINGVGLWWWARLRTAATGSASAD